MNMSVETKKFTNQKITVRMTYLLEKMAKNQGWSHRQNNEKNESKYQKKLQK